MAEQTHFLASKFRCTLSLTFGILILSWCELKAIGMLTLFPMMVAPVCRVRDPFQLTCTASVEFIRWSIVVVNEQGMEEEITVSRNSRDSSPPPRERIINSTTFTFTRTSAEDVLPLISTLTINSTSIGLNGTVVHCVDAINPMSSASTTIYIININMYTPTLRVISEEYGVENVTVTVDWPQQVSVTYTARLSPLAPTLSTGSNSRQLILSYNTEYNLSVVAVTPCGNATAFIRLDYGNCGDPTLLLPVNNSVLNVVLPVNNSVLNVESYDGLPIEGSTVRFSCPPELVLVGPNSATCTENGEWEPDPSGLMCNDSKEGSTVRFSCPPGSVLVRSSSATCTENGEWEPDPSGLMCNDSKALESEKVNLYPIVTCGHPFQDRMSGDHLIIIMGYMDPAMEGATVTLVCPPQYALIGPNTTMCTGNGEWEPNPMEVECKGLEEKIEESRSANVFLVTVSSVVVAFLIISLLMFVTGFVCGLYFGRKYKQSSSSLTPPVPLYEDVNVLPSAVEHQEQGLELKENVAYGPSKSTTIKQ